MSKEFLHSGSRLYRSRMVTLLRQRLKTQEGLIGFD